MFDIVVVGLFELVALFYFDLLFFVLFCFVLFCFVLFCFVLFCFVLFCFVLLVVLYIKRNLKTVTVDFIITRINYNPFLCELLVFIARSQNSTE